ncbi:unnamed protein product, partial [Ectocarpus fasciculatus]
SHSERSGNQTQNFPTCCYNILRSSWMLATPALRTNTHAPTVPSLPIYQPSMSASNQLLSGGEQCGMGQARLFSQRRANHQPLPRSFTVQVCTPHHLSCCQTAAAGLCLSPCATTVYRRLV